MRIDWIDDLIALLDTSSVVEAASARNVSQSAFSRRIQALESLLNVTLIDRVSKPNQPSVVLRNNEQQLRQASAYQRRMISQIQQESRSGSRIVVIACQHAITTSLGPSVVATASRQGKNHVRLRSANHAECEALLLTGMADFSFTYRLPGEPLGGNSALTEETVIAEETLIPIFPAVGLDDLLSDYRNGELNIIAYPSDVFLGIALNNSILPEIESKCRVSVIAETALTPAAMQLSKAGVGLSWVPRALAASELDEGQLVDLREMFGSLDMHIVARRRREVLSGDQEDIWERLITSPV